MATPLEGRHFTQLCKSKQGNKCGHVHKRPKASYTNANIQGGKHEASKKRNKLILITNKRENS
jgi:hypothetical protein